jgi:hypothetical protein
VTDLDAGARDIVGGEGRGFVHHFGGSEGGHLYGHTEVASRGVGRGDAALGLRVECEFVGYGETKGNTYQTDIIGRTGTGAKGRRGNCCEETESEYGREAGREDDHGWQERVVPKECLYDREERRSRKA